MKQSVPWSDFLKRRLSAPEKATTYLQVCLEEYMEDGDSYFFLKGVKNVVEAQGGICNVSEQSEIEQKLLSDAIDNGSMPPFQVLNRIFLSLTSGIPVDAAMAQASQKLGKTPRESFSAIQPPVLEQQVSLFKSESGDVDFRRSADRNLTERQEQNSKYWKYLSPHLSWLGHDIKHLTPSKSHYRDLPIKGTGCALRARQTIKPKEISASFVMRGARATGNFYSLRVEQEEIEKEFDDQLEWWSRLASEKRIGYRNREMDPADETDWHNQHTWLSYTLEKLYTILHPRIETLKDEF